MAAALFYKYSGAYFSQPLPPLGKKKNWTDVHSKNYFGTCTSISSSCCVRVLHRFFCSSSSQYPCPAVRVTEEHFQKRLNWQAGTLWTFLTEKSTWCSHCSVELLRVQIFPGANCVLLLLKGIARTFLWSASVLLYWIKTSVCCGTVLSLFFLHMFMLHWLLL